VSTGVLVAALPAITPAPTPPDVTISAQVPKDLYADVALRLSAHDLIDAFFATGVPGVTQQLLLAIAGGYQPGVDTINAFFDGGLPAVLQTILIANGDPNSFEAALINGFFDGNPNSSFEYPGIPDPIRQILIANGNPDSFEADLINGFFLDGGLPDVVRQILIANGNPDSFEADLINGFFNGNPDSGFEYPGIPEPTRLLINAALPDGSAAEGLVNAFFLDGGLPAVVQALLPSNALTQAFFAGGAPAVVGAVLLGITNAVFGEGSVPSGAVNSFFVGYPPVGNPGSPSGVVGLTHFIIDALMGDITQPTPAPAPVAPSAKTFLAAASGPSATTADLPKASDPIATDAPTVTLHTASPVTTDTPEPKPVAAVTDPSPAAPSGTASDPAPAAPAAAPSDPAPAATPSVDPPAAKSGNGTGKADDVTDAVKSGNKAEVDPLLLENGGGGGSLEKTINSFRDFIDKLRGGGTDSAKAESTNEGTGEG